MLVSGNVESTQIKIKKLAKELCLKVTEEGKDRLLVAVVGIPCSGKTTIASKLSEEINRMRPSFAVSIPMDGFHYSRKQLDEFEDPARAHRYRGAHWTFDAEGFGDCLKRVKQGKGGDVFVPGFNHAKKDPEANAIKIPPSASICIVEGLYCLLEIPPWSHHVLPLFDQRVLINCSYQTASRRIVNRHVTSGICPDRKSAKFRWEDNDRPNGEFLLKHLDFKKLNYTFENSLDSVL